MSHHFESGMFGSGKSAWHNLDTVVAGTPNSAEAIKLAGLDWKVEKRKLFLNEEVYSPYRALVSSNMEVKSHFANVRDKDSKVLGVVSKDYKIIQNDEWFAFLDILLGEGLKFETAGSLFGGKQVFMLALLPEKFKLAGDEFRQYLLATNGHDGKHVGRILCTDIRVVCWNTLSAALAGAKRSWSIRHTSNLKGKEDEVRQHLKLANLYFEAYQKKAEELLAKSFSEKEWNGLVQKLIPIPDDSSDKQKIKLISKRVNLASSISTPDLENIKRTSWGAVQATAAYVGKQTAQRSSSTWLDNKFNNMLIKGDPMTIKALELVQA